MSNTVYDVVMARSWQYSRYRRAIMQGVMWLVLGATVGLAGLQARQHRLPVKSYKIGPWRILVPADWAQSERGNLLEFQEPPGSADGGRELLVESDTVDPRERPAAFLADTLHLDLLPNSKPIAISGQPGVIVPLPEQDGFSIYSAAVMPNGDALTVRLHVPRRLAPQDAVLAEAIDGAIEYQPSNDRPTRPGEGTEPDRPDNPDSGD